MRANVPAAGGQILNELTRAVCGIDRAFARPATAHIYAGSPGQAHAETWVGGCVHRPASFGAGAHRSCSRRRRPQMRMFWVIVSSRLVPECEPGEACLRPPAKGLDRRALGPTARVVAASVLAGGGRWRDNDQPRRLAARSGQVHAVGHPVAPDVFPASPCRRPAADPRRSMAGAAGRPSPEPGPHPPGPASAPLGDGRPALSGGQPEVLLIRCKARPSSCKARGSAEAGARSRSNPGTGDRRTRSR